ncbi:MAG: Aminopeptidase [Prolixibacteraceae bacterium]|nr:MAG: Aminopeptidase [Prolixibacteraceae bacterium]
MNLRVLITAVFAVVFALFGFAGNEGKSNKPHAGYVFDDEIVLPATPVKDQYRSNTCWSFSGLSFLESEMLRLGKPEVDLSEMYIVRFTYSEKAKRYIRMHGSNNFSAGGAFHDVKNIINQFGIVPESVYRGLEYGASKHMHDEMDNLLKQQVDEIINSCKIKQDKVCNVTISTTLNKYLGEVPQSFEYEGKTYTPQTFAAGYIGLNMDDYIEITSYTHHPFYSKFILEVPDNWSWDYVYNVPVNELEEIIDYSLNNGITVAWAADVSEKGFATSNKGVAVLPVAPAVEMTREEVLKWEGLPEKEKQKELYKLDRPVAEIDVTQERRQLAFDNYETTDDHGMHIIGTAKNQDGKVFYKVKNSWGDYNNYNGYFYASKPYVNYKTMSVMVHKDGVPQHIREKLKL